MNAKRSRLKKHQIHALQRKVIGMTLIELMVTVSILAILLAVGVPGFQDFFASNRTATLSSDFVTSLNLARSEAIKRGQRVVVCKSAAPTATSPTCITTGTWANGWIVFVDDNNDGTRQNSTNEPVLRVHDALDQATLSGNTNVDNYISYTATGTTNQLGTVTLCASPYQRQIIIGSGGRIRVQVGSC